MYSACTCGKEELEIKQQTILINGLSHSCPSNGTRSCTVVIKAWQHLL